MTKNITQLISTIMYGTVVGLSIIITFTHDCTGIDYPAVKPIVYKKNPAPDGHRCGVCPTYFQKICAFNFGTNDTYIFDNHCVMDLYNCMEGTDFIPLKYDHCVYFGNFAYVHGFKYEDEDYGEDHIIVKNTQKNPIYIR